MDRLATDPQFAKVVVFRVDFDSSKELLRRWKVAYQSTLLAFKGAVEQARSEGETDETALRMLFQAAL